MIKAVLFDIDGVLLDSFEANRAFYGELLSNFGYSKPTAEEFQKVFHMSMMDAIKYSTQSKNKDEIHKIWEAGRDINVPEGLLTAPINSENIVSILSKDYSLGVVTSRIRQNIYRAPQMVSIEKYFSTAVGYEDVENHKPHPASLILAAERLGVNPNECVYVGDMPTDMQAAKAAGMKFILYAKDALPEADAITYSFLELPNIIKSLDYD